MAAPRTAEELKDRARKALEKFERKPNWLKKRAQKDYAFEHWKKNFPIDEKKAG